MKFQNCGPSIRAFSDDAAVLKPLVLSTASMLSRSGALRMSMVYQILGDLLRGAPGAPVGHAGGSEVRDG